MCKHVNLFSEVLRLVKDLRWFRLGEWGRLGVDRSFLPTIA